MTPETIFALYAPPFILLAGGALMAWRNHVVMARARAEDTVEEPKVSAPAVEWRLETATRAVETTPQYLRHLEKAHRAELARQRREGSKLQDVTKDLTKIIERQTSAFETIINRPKTPVLDELLGRGVLAQPELIDPVTGETVRRVILGDEDYDPLEGLPVFRVEKNP